MATNILPIPAVSATATSKPATSSTTAKPMNGNSNWWVPLFGLSSSEANADYIDDNNGVQSLSTVRKEEKKSKVVVGASSKFAPGCFTEEKAKQMRMMTMDTASFHDVMYHSAIASRMASDFSDNQP